MNKPLKPRLTKQVQNCWGDTISVPAFDNDDQIHAAMDDYADKLSEYYCGEELEKVIWFDFKDGSSDSTVVERVTKEFSYKTYYHPETWEKDYCVASWYESLYEIKSTSLPVIAKKLARSLDCEDVIKEIRYEDA